MRLGKDSLLEKLLSLDVWNSCPAAGFKEPQGEGEEQQSGYQAFRKSGLCAELKNFHKTTGQV